MAYPSIQQLLDTLQDWACLGKRRGQGSDYEIHTILLPSVHSEYPILVEEANQALKLTTLACLCGEESYL